MNEVYSVFTDKYFINICALIFYERSTLPQMCCPLYLTPIASLLVDCPPPLMKIQHFGNHVSADGMTFWRFKDKVM